MATESDGEGQTEPTDPILVPEGDITETSSYVGEAHEEISLRSANTTRLVDWNVELLKRLIKEILAHRDETPYGNETTDGWMQESYSFEKLPIEEIQEIIVLPPAKPNLLKKKRNINEIQLESSVSDQLHDYVSNIAVL